MSVLDEASRHVTITLGDNKYKANKLTLLDYSLIKSEIKDIRKAERQEIINDVPDSDPTKGAMIRELIGEPDTASIMSYLQTFDGLAMAIYLAVAEDAGEDCDGPGCISKYITLDTVNEFTEILGELMSSDDNIKKSKAKKKGRR